MARLITQQDVLDFLHNQLGHRVAPGGTDEDLKRYIQDAFDYSWRYYKWTFSMRQALVADNGLLPTDFDHDGYRVFDGFTELDLSNPSGGGTVAVVWSPLDAAYKLEPATATTVTYQCQPPLLGESGVPFPSVSVIAEGALIFAKRGNNPNRADVQQEWDEWHSRLDRLVGRSDNAKPRRPRNYHDVQGTFTGAV